MRSTAPVRTTTRRQTSDILRLALGLLLLTWAAIAAGSGDPSRVEINLFRLINQFPDPAGAPLIGVMQLGALAAVPVVAIVCVLSRRARLARLLALGGVGAWLVAKAIGALVAKRPPDERISGVVLHGAVTPGLSFPSTHVAVAAAMATIASPYLSRSARRTAWLLVAIVAVARVYVGAHYPADVVGGFAVGWVVGSVLHLLFGAPRGVPDPKVLAYRLGQHGIAVREIIALAGERATFRVETTDGATLHLRVVDNDRREADWLYRAWRLVAFRDPGEAGETRDPDHAVEHEALAYLLACNGGVPVPEVRWTRRLSEGESVLLRTWVGGCDLTTIDPADLDALMEAWRLLDRLHCAQIAHGGATARKFVVAGRDVAVIGLSQARMQASAVDCRHDIAELLASSSATFGTARSVRAAADALGAAPLLDALPVLQPLALSRETRSALREAGVTVDELRDEVAGIGPIPNTRAERPLWVAARNLAPLVLGGVAVVVLLTQIGNLRLALDAARNANPAWIAVAAMSAGIGYVMAAVSMMGAAPEPLALGRTTVVQFAAAFTNRIAPAGLGAMATNVRYLEHSGIRRARAATAVGVNAAGGAVVHIVLLMTVIPIVGLRTKVALPSAPDLSDYWPIAAVIVISLSIAGVWYWRHGLRSVFERLRPHTRDIRGVLAQPRRGLMLFGGSAGVTVAQAFVFVACLEAVGVHLPPLTAFAVFLAGVALAAAAPTPGGLGALEAALIAGLGQVGVPAAPAVAAVLLSRIIGYWLPVLPGWLAFTLATRNEMI
jgi:glycosyltransferase 2 family protein